MKLSNEIREQIIGSVEIRAKLMLALKLNDVSILRLAKTNHEKLTNASAMKVLREVTGLQDEDILEPETVNS